MPFPGTSELTTGGSLGMHLASVVGLAVIGIIGVSAWLIHRQRRDRLATVLDAVQDGIWDVDLRSGAVFYSRGWKEMLGYQAEEIGQGLEEWSTRIHPEDHDRVVAEFERHLRGDTPFYSSEHRLRCRDGTWKWVLDRGRVVRRDAAGAAMRVIGTHVDISARRQAEARMNSAQELARQLITTSPLGIVVYDGGTGSCLQANVAAAGILGVSIEDLRSQNFRRIPSWRSSGLLQAAQDAVADGHPRRDEVEVRTDRGHNLWLSYHMNTLAGEGGPLLLVVFEDVTLRKRLERAQEELQSDLEHRVTERTLELAGANKELRDRERSLRLFQAVIEQNPIAIFITGPDGRITYANPAFASLLGAPGREAIGQDARGLARADAQGAAWISALDEGKTWVGTLCQGDEDIRWIDASIAPVTGPDEGRLGSVGFLRDITATKAAEAQERQRAQDMVQADRLAALGTLVAGVGHEITNPANFISLNIPLLRGFWDAAEPVLAAQAEAEPGFTLNRLPWSRVRDQVPRLYDGIGAGIDRIRRIVGELRDFARPGSGEHQPQDLDRVVTAAVTITHHAIAKATHRFTLRLAGGLPPVSGSFQHLEQVLVNLILNACQALPGPDRGITVGTAVVRDQVVITVVDEGVGIPAEHMRRLGEPFFTTKRERGGTGLGLSVVRRILDAHGGELHMTSTPDAGTTVAVHLPIQRRDHG